MRVVFVVMEINGISTFSSQCIQTCKNSTAAHDVVVVVAVVAVPFMMMILFHQIYGFVCVHCSCVVFALLVS